MTEAKTYTKLFTAKMIAAKLSKKTGEQHIHVAIEGGFKVVTVAEYEAHKVALAAKKVGPQTVAKVRKSSAPEGGVFGSQIPCGKASYEEQIAALWKFAEISNDRKMVNYLTGMNEDYLKMVLGKSKTRWGAIGNVRAAMEAV